MLSYCRRLQLRICVRLKTWLQVPSIQNPTIRHCPFILLLQSAETPTRKLLVADWFSLIKGKFSYLKLRPFLVLQKVSLCTLWSWHFKKSLYRIIYMKQKDPPGYCLCFIGEFGIRACISVSTKYSFFRIYQYALLPSKCQLQANERRITTISTKSTRSWFSSPERSLIKELVILKK